MEGSQNCNYISRSRDIFTNPFDWIYGFGNIATLQFWHLALNLAIHEVISVAHAQSPLWKPSTHFDLFVQLPNAKLYNEER